MANNAAKIVATKPSAARLGTIGIIRRLYRLSCEQTIELVVMAAGFAASCSKVKAFGSLVFALMLD
jgi:hypothetical protein